MRENKVKFVEELGELVYRFSRENVEQMRYDEKTETVIVYYENGHTARVPVACDSVVAIMKDVGDYFCKH